MNTRFFSCVFLLVLCVVDIAGAREVSVLRQNESGPLSRSEMLQTAFRKAVLDEALDILPAVPAQDRVALLADYLAPRSDQYVLSYAELADETSTLPGNATVAADVARYNVDVNRDALKSELQSIGIFYTVGSSFFYDLRLGENASAGWTDIGAMQRLSGLRVKSGTMPVLFLEQSEDGLWVGTLEGTSREWRGVDKDLRALWVELWRGFFARPEIEKGLFESVEIEISGWFTPDGVRAFDEVLNSWDKAVENAVLTFMGMTPTGISARWTVKSIDRVTLMDRLDAYLPPRGLRFGFGEEAVTEETQTEDGATFQEMPDTEYGFGEGEREGSN